MREIDSYTKTCIKYFESGCKGNTMIAAKDGEVRVYLHANFIYSQTFDTEVFTLAGWNTNVTRNRLNACLKDSYVFQKNYTPYLKYKGHDIELDDGKYYKHVGCDWFSSDSEWGETWAPITWEMC